METAPEQRDLVNALSGTGTLKPANTYNVKSLVSGKVLTCSFEEGDNVEEGDVLYTVDSSDATTKAEQAGITLQQAQRNYDKTVDRQYVRAEVAGVVSSLKVAKGDEVTSGQEVAVIRDNSKMTLALEFPAADAAGFSVGQSADVTLDGTFETLTGTITAVTGTDALSTGNLLTRTVTISVRNAGGLTTAQAATATVNGVSAIGAATFQYQAERTLTTLAAGTVTAIHAREGDSVNKDDIVLQISGDDLSESIQSASETLRGAELSMQSTQDAMNNYTITSPINGTIIEKSAKAGDALSAGSDLCTIYDLSYLEMTINVDELQVSSLSVGQTVQVTADAVQDRTYEGVVTRVSMKGDTSAAAFVRDSAGDKPTEKGAAAAAPALSENDLALLRKLDAAGALETLAGTKQSAAGRRRARAPGGRAAQSGGAGAQPKAAGAAAQAEIFCPKSHRMDDFLSRRTAAGPQGGKEGRGGRFDFRFRQSRCFPRFFFGERGPAFGGKKGHRPRMGLLFTGAERLFFTTRRMRQV